LIVTRNTRVTILRGGPPPERRARTVAAIGVTAVSLPMLCSIGFTLPSMLSKYTPGRNAAIKKAFEHRQKTEIPHSRDKHQRFRRVDSRDMGSHRRAVKRNVAIAESRRRAR
jgi:hypothetical protein